MDQPTLVVMAAGIGSRYGGLKQADPVGPSGEWVIDYSIYDALRAGFGQLVFIIRRDIEAIFREKIGERWEKRVPVQYVHQELGNFLGDFQAPASRKKPWGTGHAILVSRTAVNEPFGVINADDFYGAHSFQVLADHLKNAKDSQVAEYSMVGFKLRNTITEHGSVARGVCQCNSSGFLEKVVEYTKIETAGGKIKNTDGTGREQVFTGNEVVSMNMWGFTPSLYGQLEQRFRGFLREWGQDEKAEYFIPTVVDALISEGRARVRVLPTKDSWFGITYKEDKPRVIGQIQKLVADGIYPAKLWL